MIFSGSWAYRYVADVCSMGGVCEKKSLVLEFYQPTSIPEPRIEEMFQSECQNDAQEEKRVKIAS